MHNGDAVAADWLLLYTTSECPCISKSCSALLAHITFLEYIRHYLHIINVQMQTLSMRPNASAAGGLWHSQIESEISSARVVCPPLRFECDSKGVPAQSLKLMEGGVSGSKS